MAINAIGGSGSGGSNHSHQSPHRVLIADDDDASRELLIHLLEGAGFAVVSANDGSQALEMLKEQRIDLVLLDVMMPGQSGFSVCRHLKSDPATKLIPVVLVTGLSTTSDRVLGIEVGADDFLSKPVRSEELLARVRSLLRIKDYLNQLENAESVLFTLALGVEAKDPFTEGHCERLANYSVALGKRLGLNEANLTALRRGGMVHDIGKLGVFDHILQKPGPLTDEERLVMRLHPAIGEKICAPLRSFKLVLPIIRHHHEKLDGSGYPDGLKNGQIPLTAKILSAADVYDALTTDRPFRRAISPESAFEIISDEVKKGWWDSDLIAEFQRIIFPSRLQPSQHRPQARQMQAGQNP